MSVPASADDGRLPAVSVVIPTCDRPSLLQRALASVRAQTLAPAEVIVVDDGRDPAARPRLADAGVRLLVNTRARGASGARNCGAAHAVSPVLAFLDDDDEWLPDYLATAVARLAAERLDVLCTDLLYRYEEDGSERAGKPAPAALDVSLFLERNPGLIGSNLIIRAATYAAIGGFDESLLTSEDMDLGIRLSLAAPRYAPLRARLVAHHQHRRARLCTRRGEAMRAGIQRFFALHGARMTAAQQATFRQNIQRLWGIDEHGRDLETPP